MRSTAMAELLVWFLASFLRVEEDVGVEEAGAADYELVEEGQDGGGIVDGDEGGRERVELRSGVGERERGLRRLDPDEEDEIEADRQSPASVVGRRRRSAVLGFWWSNSVRERERGMDREERRRRKR